jgi:hypothetical protein
MLLVQMASTHSLSTSYASPAPRVTIAQEHMYQCQLNVLEVPTLTRVKAHAPRALMNTMHFKGQSTALPSHLASELMTALMDSQFVSILHTVAGVKQHAPLAMTVSFALKALK